MTGLDTIAQPTRRTVDPIGSRSRHESEARPPGASFDDVLAQTARESATPSGRSAVAASNAQVREEAAERAEGAEVAETLDSAETADTADVADGTEVSTSSDAAEATDLTDDLAGTDTLRTLAQHADAAETATAGSLATAGMAQNAEPVEAAAASVVNGQGTAITTSPTAGGTAAVAGTDPASAAKPAGPPQAPASADPAVEGAVIAPTASAVGSATEAATESANDVAADAQPAVAGTSSVSADATGSDAGSDAGADTALLQAAARAAAEDAAVARPNEAQSRRTPQVVAVDSSAASDLAGIDASSGDQAAPEAAPALTATQRGTEATTRLTEHVAMREMFNRIERHRSSIDGSIELEILTERFGAIRIEAAEGTDGVHLSLRGGNGDDRALADLADELRQEFERNGVDLAGLDVGDRKGERPGAEVIEELGNPLARPSDLDDSPLRRLGGDAGRLDLRL